MQKAHNRFVQAAARLPQARSLLSQPRQRFDTARSRLARALSSNTQAHHTRFARVAGRLRPAPILNRIDRCQERTQALGERARRSFRLSLDRRAHALDAQAKLLSTLSYQSVLQRGYAIVRDESGAMVRSALRSRHGKGSKSNWPMGGSQRGNLDGPTRGAEAIVRAEAAPPPAVKPLRKKPGGGGQGSLF